MEDQVVAEFNLREEQPVLATSLLALFLRKERGEASQPISGRSVTGPGRSFRRPGAALARGRGTAAASCRAHDAIAAIRDFASGWAVPRELRF